jgi:hypothetical protein
MSLFFNAQQTLPVIRNAVQDALARNPATIANLQQEATNIATTLTNQVAPAAFAWSRFLGAMAFLAVIFVAGVYTARDPQLQDWSKVLLHAFEICLGGVVGIVIGEKTSRS